MSPKIKKMYEPLFFLFWSKKGELDYDRPDSEVGSPISSWKGVSTKDA